MSNKKKKIIVISVIASLIALTSITIAVFTAKDEVINDFKVADIDVKVDEKWHEPDSWSGERLEKVAKVTNKLQTAEGKGMPAMIRVAVEPRWEDKDGNPYLGDINCVEFEFSNVTDNINTKGSWYKADDGYYYYTSVVMPGESTNDIIKSIKLKDSVTNKEKEAFDGKELKAVVRAEAIFSGSNKWKVDWNITNTEVINLLSTFTAQGK
ncbi:MAG: hypothetical protein MR274_00445 [Clostridium sp.]|nr:hypothetical protein [Clostridium sp.]